MYAHLPTYLETTFPGASDFQREGASDPPPIRFVPLDSGEVSPRAVGCVARLSQALISDS